MGQNRLWPWLANPGPTLLHVCFQSAQVSHQPPEATLFTCETTDHLHIRHLTPHYSLCSLQGDHWCTHHLGGSPMHGVEGKKLLRRFQPTGVHLWYSFKAKSRMETWAVASRGRSWERQRLDWIWGWRSILYLDTTVFLRAQSYALKNFQPDVNQ